MALHPLSRPSLLSSTLTASADYICQTCKRHQSSFRRTRKALRIQPAPSFAPSKTETGDHIIFNPPSSAPNVYHTPQKFLPPNDPRRRLHSVAPSHTSIPPSTPGESATTSPPNATESLPPPVRSPYAKKYHLTPAQVEEIRRLRAEDPRAWTRAKLAERFECSQFFVSLCCCAPEIKAEREKELEQIKSKWGRRKREAREDRKEREKLWGMDV